MKLSVVLPTHNPDAGRLCRVLAALRAQTLPSSKWELLLVDNASTSPVAVGTADAPAHFRILREPEPGLSHARRCGFTEACGDFVVLVDDDNLLSPDYLESVVQIFASHPQIGAIGGTVRPEFEREPEPWMREFDALLACRDLGPTPRISSAGTKRNEYPAFAPIGAGLAARRRALDPWLNADPAQLLSDRRGSALSSGGDNEIIFRMIRAGWAVGYFPELNLTHLIPSTRLSRSYLARLNRGIQQSWVQVLQKYEASPWPSIPAWSVPLRQCKAWFAHRGWAGPAAFIRWQGACGHFEGRART